MKSYDYVIIGAGTSGLTARKRIAKFTQNYVVVDNGILGTTCARVGCMPSKVLIQVANEFHKRLLFDEQGIRGQSHLEVDPTTVLKHVRKLRDRFVKSVFSGMESWRETHLIQKRASFIDANTLDLEGEKVSFKKAIIATGSSPVIPKPWQEFSEFLIDTNGFFELPTLPNKMAVIGLGVIGIELGQALHKLGIDVIGISKDSTIAGISDPKVREYVCDKLNEEMNLDFSGVSELKKQGNQLLVKTSKNDYLVDKALISVGRSPNLKSLKLENLIAGYDGKSIPDFCKRTLQLKDHKHIAIAGDVNGMTPILHESADEGFIAAHFLLEEETKETLKRRTPLGITFSSPNIAYVGKKYQQLVDAKVEFEIGESSFEGQGRSIIMGEEKGILRVYGETKTGKLLGAELFAPSGEHLAHLLAWAISAKQSVFDTLANPFYHPVVEEGLRTALRNLARKISNTGDELELVRCIQHPTNDC